MKGIVWFSFCFALVQIKQGVGDTNATIDDNLTGEADAMDGALNLRNAPQNSDSQPINASTQSIDHELIDDTTKPRTGPVTTQRENATSSPQTTPNVVSDEFFEDDVHYGLSGGGDHHTVSINPIHHFHPFNLWKPFVQKVSDVVSVVSHPNFPFSPANLFKKLRQKGQQFLQKSQDFFSAIKHHKENQLFGREDLS